MAVVSDAVKYIVSHLKRVFTHLVSGSIHSNKSLLLGSLSSVKTRLMYISLNHFSSRAIEATFK